MSAQDAKLIRKQVRNVVQEILGETMSSELVQALEKRLLDVVNQRLTLLHKQVEESLKIMDKKVSDGVSYIVRHTGDMPLKVKLDK